MNKLNATAAGLAFGIMWAVSLFFFVIFSILWGYGSEWVTLIGSVYLGVDTTWAGAFIALPWAFVDAFIGGYIVVWLYNKLV